MTGRGSGYTVRLPGLLARLRGSVRRPEPVVVVSGLPRSGTSMLMGMLAAGGLDLLTDGARAADEDNPRGYYELERVKALDKAGGAAWLADARGKGVKIISFLLAHLPDTCRYKIVFMRRSLPEVLRSQRRMLERRGEGAGDAGDEQLAGLFAAHLRKVETQLAARPNCDVLYVEHQDTLQDPARVAHAVDTFLGGRLDVAAMARAVDRRLYRNRAASLP